MSTWLQATAGEGPAECCWVVARLVEILQVDAGRAGLELDLLEAVPGDESSTLKSVLLSLDGENTSEFVRAWQGTIQWIGKSPYRPLHKRKNWFVAIECFQPPEKPCWEEKDLRIEVMRSSGPGGQHVNKTSSAVRVTHVPTGLNAVAREERSQRRNRLLALARLAARFEEQHTQAEGAGRRARWQQHHALVRGNAVRVYEGPEFRFRRPTRKGKG